MDKTQKFSVIKEKIIKTNDLLGLVCEKNEALEKSKQWVQQLKTRLELSRNELRIAKVKNEALSCDLKSTNQKYSSLKNEHDKLTQEHNHLKNETDKTINQLQVNYQLTNQELTECNKKLVHLEKLNFVDDEISLKELAKKKKRVSAAKDKTTQTHNSDTAINEKLYKLQKENERKNSEISNLQFEILELKKKLKDTEQLEDGLEIENKLKEDELQELKNEFKTAMDKKEKECEELLQQIKISKRKGNDLEALNEKLKNKNAAFQLEISMLQETNKEDSLHSKQEVLSELQNELKRAMNMKKMEIDDLCTELKSFKMKSQELQAENEKLKMSILQKASNVSTNKNSEELISEELPFHKTLNSTANESTKELPHKNKRMRTRRDTPSDYQISEIMNQIVPPVCLSPKCGLNAKDGDSIEDITESYDDYFMENSAQLKANKATHSYSNPTLVRLVKRRRNLLKRKRLFARKKSKDRNLLQALLALKEANISFLIGNNAIEPSYVHQAYPSPPKWTTSDVKTTPKTVTNQLDCSLDSCKNMHMLLEDDANEDDMKLLGFFDVKKETHSAEKENDVCLQVPQKKRKIGDNCDKIKQNELNDKYKNGDSIRNESNQIEDSEVTDLTIQNVGIESENVRNCDTRRYITRGRTKSSLLSVIKTCKSLRKRQRTLSESVSDYISNNNDESISPALKSSNEEDGVSQLKLSPQKFPSRTRIKDKSREITANSSTLEDGIRKSSSSEKLTSPTKKSTPEKTSFKRPLCSLRRSPRFKLPSETTNTHETRIVERIDYESPRSPTPSVNGDCPDATPVLIPLEKVEENVEKLPTSKVEVLFNKLIVYSAEEEVLNEVVREFTSQDPQFIAEAILERVAIDYHDAPDTKHYPAPLMTDVQRTMLGFMSKLEKTNVMGVFESYLTLAEKRLLTSDVLQEMPPITRLYLAVCKVQKNITRMRRLCCDVFYFCGDIAVPFLFTVLTSWTEVLPHAADSKEMPIARVLVQAVYMKECTTPGYKLLALRDLLIKFYGYPTERWDVDEFFKELLHAYLRNPVRSSDFALLLYCKNRPEKWVYDTIEEQLKPILQQIPSENFKAHVIILIGNLYNRFSSKSEVNYLPRIREWFSSLITEGTPDVVRRSVYFCLNRLKKR